MISKENFQFEWSFKELLKLDNKTNTKNLNLSVL